MGMIAGDGSDSAQPDPFPAEAFDAWAETYEQDTQSDVFPFTGYRSVLDAVVALSGAQPGDSLLDLGAGTGNLSWRFASLGCELWLTDFSKEMLNQARLRLPGARFFTFDLRAKWPADLNRRFDRIVSAYVFHHFELPEKVRLAQMLVEERLEPDGIMVIADISFLNHAACHQVRAISGDAWEDEPYWIATETLPLLQQVGIPADYHQVSNCAGIYRMKRVRTS
jgi:putative AdoMet-dependent methyltransferase